MTAGYTALCAERLQWLPELGLGFFPVQESPYDDAYWRRYIGYDASVTGGALTAARMGLVASHWSGPVVDIGIGGGRFVRERPDTRGYDVNPSAIAWLRRDRLWCDPYAEPIPAATFWDSLEHIEDPAPLLANIQHYVFVSIPIFRDADHVLRSRHFRRDEHYWYFTGRGLARFMEGHGFILITGNTMEQDFGREDIGSFVFRRQE